MHRHTHPAPLLCLLTTPFYLTDHVLVFGLAPIQSACTLWRSPQSTNFIPSQSFQPFIYIKETFLLFHSHLPFRLLFSFRTAPFLLEFGLGHPHTIPVMTSYCDNYFNKIDWLIINHNGIIHPKMVNIIIYLPSCCCKPGEFLFSVQPKRRYFEECTSCSFPWNCNVALLQWGECSFQAKKRCKSIIKYHNMNR